MSELPKPHMEALKEPRTYYSPLGDEKWGRFWDIDRYSEIKWLDAHPDAILMLSAVKEIES